jgi:mRNA interferase YafQ
MVLRFHRNFKKRYEKLRENEKSRCDRALELFAVDPFHPLLHNHSLRGRFAGYRSINIGGDLRAIYKLAGEDVAYFVELGTHEELYSS